MEFAHNEYFIPSKTGVADIYVQSIVPENVRGVLQIVHGMAEHSDRYLEAARYFAAHGFAVFMSDHAGHGKSIKTREDLGYFGEHNGEKSLVEDAKAVTALLREKCPGKPVILWGHSMGSFVTRAYIAKYGNTIDGAVICGTSGANPGAAVGAVLANAIARVKGSHYRSPFINNLAFGSYNKKFEGNTGFEWLSVNKENVEKYVADDLCGYLFTATAYRDMFRLLASVSGKDWYAAVPKALPLRLIAGEMDPVGNYGKGVQEVYDNLKAAGCNVTLRLFPGLRHEIHNEDSREDTYADILAFAEKCAP